VLFLTALGDTRDELNGFGAGADDYIVKPFEYEILMARVKAMLKRVQGSARPVIQIGELVLDDSARRVTLEGAPVELAPKEYELLAFLAANRNIALDRDTILNGVWGTDFFGDPRTVDTHIKNLRSKIGSAGDRIKTVRGHGYRLEG
jgi:DNA-binding response OmpR family regulator